MPLFAVHALDKPGSLQLRLEIYAAHRAFVETEAEHRLNILLSGPLQTDDGEMMIGSLFIIDAPDHDTVSAFCEADPFYTSGVWGDVRITRFNRRKGWNEAV
jgi:uncharacterized protein YciI